MFNYLPKKFQNLVLVLVLTSSAIQMLSELQSQFVYFLAHQENVVYGSVGRTLAEIVFLLIVIAACALTLRKNAKNGEDSLV
jgi:hypothetical protein